MLKSFLLVGFGGFIGSILRFGLSRFIQGHTFSTFPFAILLVNIIGCLVIGFVYGVSEKGDVLPPDVRLFLTVGLCGGFTTFSSFSNDSFLLLREREYLFFSLYVAASVLLCLLAVYMGRMLTKLL